MPDSQTRVAADFDVRLTAAGRVWQSRSLAVVAQHVFTSRDLRLREPSMAVDLERLAGVFDVHAADLVLVRQVHGAVIHEVEADGPIRLMPEADAVISTDPARPIVIRVADCVPILLADRHGRAVAAIHAGWRGTAAGVAGKTVERLRQLGIPPSDLHAAIGPSIGPCCYQVSRDTRQAFLDTEPATGRCFRPDDTGKWLLDLWRANAADLERSGVRASKIQFARVCTADRPRECFSFRKEGAETGRMAAAIRLRPAVSGEA